METMGQRAWITDPYDTHRGQKKTLYQQQGYRTIKRRVPPKIYKPVDRSGERTYWNNILSEEQENSKGHNHYINNDRDPVCGSWCLQDLAEDPYDPLLPGYYHQYLTPFNQYHSGQVPLKAKLCATSFKDLEPDPQELFGHGKMQVKADDKISAYDYCNPGKHVMKSSMVKLAVSHVPEHHGKKADGGPKGLLEYRTHRVDETLTRMAVVKGDLLDLLAVQFNAREILRDVYSHVQGGEVTGEPAKWIQFNNGVTKKTDKNHGYNNVGSRRVRNDGANGYLESRGEMTGQSAKWIQFDGVKKGDKYYGYSDGRDGSKQVQNDETNGYSRNNVSGVRHSVDTTKQQKMPRRNSVDCGKHGDIIRSSSSDRSRYSQITVNGTDRVQSERDYGSGVWSHGKAQVEHPSEQELQTTAKIKPDKDHVSDVARHGNTSGQTSLRHDRHHPLSDHSATSYNERLTRSSTSGPHLSDKFSQQSLCVQSPDEGSRYGSRQSKRSLSNHSSDAESYITAQSHLGSDTQGQRVIQSDADIDEEVHPAGLTMDCRGKSTEDLEKYGNGAEVCSVYSSRGTTKASVGTNLPSDTLKSQMKSSRSNGVRLESNDRCSCSCHSPNQTLSLHQSHQGSVKGLEEAVDVHVDSCRQSDTNLNFKDKTHCNGVSEGTFSQTHRQPFDSSQHLHNDVDLYQRNTHNTPLYQPVNEHHRHHGNHLKNDWYPPIPGTIDNNTMATTATSASAKRQVLHSNSHPVFPMNSSTPRGGRPVDQWTDLRSRSHCGCTVPCCDYHTRVNVNRSRMLVPYGVGSSNSSSTTTESLESDLRRHNRKQLHGTTKRTYKHYELDLESSSLTLDDLVGGDDSPTAGYANRLALYGLQEGGGGGVMRPVTSLPVTAIWDQKHMGRSLTTSSLHSTLTPQGYSTTDDDDCRCTRHKDVMPPKSRLQENLHAFIVPITHKSSERGSPYTSPTCQSSRVSLTTTGSVSEKSSGRGSPYTSPTCKSSGVSLTTPVSEMSQSAGTYKRKESKPLFIIKPRRCFADEGGPGKFKASFDGVPTPTLTWQKDGVPLVSSDKYLLTTDEDFHYLEIRNVEKADKGTYTCVLTNPLGTTTISSELEVYAIRRKAEPAKTQGVLSTAKKFMAPTSANLSTPASVFTGKKQPESTKESTTALKSIRQRGGTPSTGGEDPAKTSTFGSAPRLRGSSSSTADQPIRSSRLHDRHEDRFTNGSIKSTENAVSRVASKFSQDPSNNNSSNESGDYRRNGKTGFSSKTVTQVSLKTHNEPEPSKSRISSWREKDRAAVKEDENKNEMSPVTVKLMGGPGEPMKAEVTKFEIHENEMPPVIVSGGVGSVEPMKDEVTKLDIQTSPEVSMDNKDTQQSAGLTTKTSLGTSIINAGRRHLDANKAKDDPIGLSNRTPYSTTTTPASNKTVHTTGTDRINSMKSRFEEKPVTNQHRVSSLAKEPEEPVSSSRKVKSTKLRSLSKKFAEFEENDQEFFFTPSKAKTPTSKEMENYSVSVMSTGEKEEEPKVTDDLERESISSGILSTEDSASVEEKAEEGPFISQTTEVKEEQVIMKQVETTPKVDEAMVKAVEEEVSNKKVDDIADEPLLEHAPVKQQVKEAKKAAAVVKSPGVSKAGEARSFGVTGRKSGDVRSSLTSKTHDTKSSSYGSKTTTDSRASSAATKAASSRVSKTTTLDSSKTSSRISPESSTTSRSSRVSPESSKTAPRSSKAVGQSDTTGKGSVRNRYQPQLMSPSTKRTGSSGQQQDAKTTSPTKRTTPLRSGTAAGSKGGSSTENLTTGRRVTGKPPEVVGAGLTDKEARDGEYVSLKCSFTGTPSPTVAWYCNGAILKDSNEIKQQFDGQWATLKFKDVFPDDTGRYEAVATNKAGEARTACLLTVKEAKPPKSVPSFSRPLQDQAVNDGECIELSCEYSGNPEPELTWYHEGKVLEPCKDFQVSNVNGVASLTIAEVFPEDAGLYELVAVNEKGEIKTVANLTVNELSPEFEEKPAMAVAETEKPTFTKALQDTVVYDGEKVTLQVEVAGSLPIEVCWVHGQKEIGADDSVYQVLSVGRVHKLVIPDVLPEDEGTWVCEAYNNFGDVDTSCQLTIRAVSDKSARSASQDSQAKEEFDEEAISRDKNILAKRKGNIRNENLNQPPKFILKPKSLNTDEGNSAKFVCEVVGNPSPMVIWKRDGVELNSVTRFKSWHDGWKYFFEITHTLVTDAGQYQCVAKSNQGEISCHIDLVVNKLDSPAEISDFRSLLKSRPQLGKIGSKSSTASESEAEQLDFRNVLTRHVKTKSKPRFVKDLHDVRCDEGQAVTLTCKVQGTPVPSITWLQGQKEIKGSRFFKMSFENETASLHIAGVYPEDQGEYICVAENSAGVAESICDLDIDYSTSNAPRAATTAGSETDSSSRPTHPHHQDILDLEPPFIEELSPENVSVLAGQTFTLTARFLGSQPLSVVWTHGKKVIESGGRFHIETSISSSLLTVTACQCGDTGIYALALSNSNGNDSISASVTIEDKPERPVGQPVVSHITAETLSLAWSGPSYDGGSQVTHYKVEIKLEGTEAWKMVTDDCQHTSFHVTGLESCQEYVFRVYAANKHGFGEPSLMSIPVVTIDRRPSFQAQEIQHANEAHADEAADEYSLSSPLSPLALLAAQNQLTMEPRFVEICDKKFTDYYDIGEEIGKGRFGNVFTCRERTSGMQLAAKKIRVKGNQKEDVLREVEIMNALHHSKLLLLYDAFSTSREMILVMEHVAGGELFERIIDEDYSLTEREAIHFMRQICEGLRYMHEKNILHLDLKPENILCITPNSNEIKIIDFGLARKFDPKNPTKVLFGTPEFVAPEVINYDQIGFETDMWSLGVVCYLLLSGLSPFLGDNEAETLANVTMATWDFEEGFEEISEEAKKFIGLLLVKDMSKRMKVNRALRHPWLSQDVTYMKAKRLSTQKHKHFLARRKWQKTGNAIRALGRMSNMQKALSFSRQSSDAASSTISNSSTNRSRNSSFASEASSSLVVDQTISSSKNQILTPPHQTLSPQHINGKSRSSDESQDINSNRLTTKKTKSSPHNIVPNEDTSQDVPSTVLNSQEEEQEVLDTAPPSENVVAFVKPVKDFEVYEGDSARFDALLEHFDERYLRVSWLKDDQEIDIAHHQEEDEKNKKFRITQTSSGRCGLIITNCDLDDDARYTCRVTSGLDGGGNGVQLVVVESSAELYVDSLYSTSTTA